MSESSVPPTGNTRLKRDAIGLPGAALLGVVVMGPSLVLYANWAPMVPIIGSRATPLVFIVAMALILPTAYSYAQLARDVPNAGTAYKWAARFVSPRLGISVGFCAILYFATLAAILPPLVGLLAADLFKTSSPVVFALAMLGSLLIALPIIYRGVNTSIDAAAILVSIEVVILTVTTVYAYITLKGSTHDLSPLSVHGIPSISALSSALVLGVLSYTGFDAVATAAEETRLARRTIPKATIIAVVLTGTYWVVMAFLLSGAMSPAKYTEVLSQGGVPLSTVAIASFGETGHVLIDLMGLEASMGVLIAAVLGASRILFAQGRDGVIDRRFAIVHPRFQVPWMSITAVVVYIAVVDTVVGLYVGFSYNIYIWLANVVVFFGLLVYISVNVSSIAYFVRHSREQFHPVKHVVVPVLGIVILAYFLYEAFFHALWGAGFQLGRSVVIVCVLLLVLTVVAGAMAGGRRQAAARALPDDLGEDELLTT